MTVDKAAGPLSGVRVVEFAGIGPGPFCAMLLGDMGVEILRIVRPGFADDPTPIDRGKAVLPIDIRSEAGRRTCIEAIRAADVLIEGFRPGVMERAGLGPEPMRALAPRLVYGRMTGWGQDGPLAGAAGHDINFLALTGVLDAFAPPDGPARPPLNLVGDFGGGAMSLAFGIVAALFERERSGCGQVVDAAIVDGVALQLGSLAGLVSLERGRGLLGGSAPHYRCYACADGREIAIGALEPRFRAVLFDRIGASPALEAMIASPDRWDEGAAILAGIFRTRPASEWVALLDGEDACVSPVLTVAEGADHPQMRARRVHDRTTDVAQASPAPRLWRRPAGRRRRRASRALACRLSGWCGNRSLGDLCAGGRRRRSQVVILCWL